MSSPTPATTDQVPYPLSYLSVEGDPTNWGLEEIAAAVSSKLATDSPAVLSVVKPVVGTLLLAPRLAASLVLTPVLNPQGGWVPCIALAAPYLYLPSPAGVTANSPGYMLVGSDANLEAAQEAITAAMSNSTQLTVNVTRDGTGSTVVINGAELQFVVLATAATQ